MRPQLQRTRLLGAKDPICTKPLTERKKKTKKNLSGQPFTDLLSVSTAPFVGTIVFKKERPNPTTSTHTCRNFQHLPGPQVAGEDMRRGRFVRNRRHHENYIPGSSSYANLLLLGLVLLIG